MRNSAVRYVTLLLLLLATNVNAEVILTEGTNFTLDVANDGRIAIDLLGSIWIVPPTGGEAERVSTSLPPVRQPRWSPFADSIVFHTDDSGRSELWLHHLDEQRSEKLGDGSAGERHASWHPDGERLVFSSQKYDSGFDLWELDIATKLQWRISNRSGDETEPAWSADGRNLAYVHHEDGQWSLMLRLFGMTDRSIVTSTERLSSPSWRPDGSLISYLRHAGDGISVEMVILSNPPIWRTLLRDEDIFVSSPAWVNNEQILYAANGVIRKRPFDSWMSSTVPFQARIDRPEASEAHSDGQRRLPSIDEPSGRVVIRTARLFDGIGGGYRHGFDIVLEGGKILSIEPRKKRPGVVVIDMGALTALPGIVDAYASLPVDADERLGPTFLSFGVTTIVAEHDNAVALNHRWSGKDMPGPRILLTGSITGPDSPRPWLVTVESLNKDTHQKFAAGVNGDTHRELELRSSVDRWHSMGVPVLAESWQAGVSSGATLVFGNGSLPISPAGRRYQDIHIANGAGPIVLASGLANAGTPGLDALQHSRQARDLGISFDPNRRFTTQPTLVTAANTVVLASKTNGLAPGIAQHAELRALAAAGVNHEQTLRAGGVNVATALGLGLQIGRLAPGGVADILIVDGDPLKDIRDTLNVVAVIRNGRFFSTVGLIERATNLSNVE